MGGKRIAEQVRRALMMAAKVAPVAVTVDMSGCGCFHACALKCDPNVEKCDFWSGAGGGGFAGAGGWAAAGSGPLIFLGGAGGSGATKDASTDADKDGG